MKFQTQKGYGFFEASSSLQKAVRRGNESLAMYFVVELFNSGYDEYVWKRLKIMTSEDVGLAAPQMPAQIAALYQMYSDLKKTNDNGRPERLFLVHAVLLLVRAKKSRLVDWTLMSYWKSHEDNHVEVPDFAIDKHTLKGKQMGRGIDHFFQEGSLLENHSVQPGEEEMKERAYKETLKRPNPMQFTKNKRGLNVQADEETGTGELFA